MAKLINAQFERIKKAFNKDEIPFVSTLTIKTYFKYPENNLVRPCLLTGIESFRVL